MLFANISMYNSHYCSQPMYSDDPCSKPLLRGYVGYSVNASSVYLDYAAENIPYGTLLEDRPNHWRPEPNLVMATLRVGVCQNHDAFCIENISSSRPMLTQIWVPTGLIDERPVAGWHQSINLTILLSVMWHSSRDNFTRDTSSSNH